MREDLDPAGTGVVLDAIPDGVLAVDHDLTITAFNRAAEEITGVPREEAIGRPCRDVLHSSLCDDGCALRESMATGERLAHRQALVSTPRGERIPLSISTSPLRDATGEVVGGVETFRDLSALEAERRTATETHAFQGIISRSRPMRRMFAILPDVARSESTVLIEGASGSGKELVARALHSLSDRAKGPWVAVNCGALPDTLLESELFGHVRGAFTDAKSDRQGRFAMAAGGTIFLDEIGDISPALQVRLLRVLQERTFEPVGSSRSRRADVRVVAATHRSLRAEVEAGRFRDDLYYRLNVVRLEVPPLSGRRDDIPLLAAHFVDQFNSRRGRRIEGLSQETLAALVRHPWPGNVRELENAIEHAFILCHGTHILPQHLPSEIAGDETTPDAPLELPMGQSLGELERRIIVAALRRHGWRRLETARELGINKTTLWRKMKRLGIEPPKSLPRGGSA